MVSGFIRISALSSGIGEAEDIAKALKINPASARVGASRYVRARLLLRLKRNTYSYLLRGRWQAASREERFALANLGQASSDDRLRRPNRHAPCLTARCFFSTLLLGQPGSGFHFKRSGRRRTLCPSISSVVFEYVSFRMILPSLKCITSTPRRFSGLPSQSFSIEGHSSCQR